MPAKYLIILTVIFGISWAQSDIPNVLEHVSVPPELEGKLDPKTVEIVQNKTLSDFKSRCEKNGGPEAFDKATNAGKELQQCLSSLVNVSALQEEIQEAKPHGGVDEVFKKYCEKKPLFENCMKNFSDTTKACFSSAEQGHLKTVFNVSQQLAEFICFKDGDRIALFIAEGGQECFSEKQEGLRDCSNKTLGMDAELDINGLSNATISFDEKQCKQISEFQTCVIGVLETCPKPTSANIVESLFKFIRKATPCKNFADEEEKPRSHNQKAEEEKKKGSAVSVSITLMTLVSAFAITLLA